MPEYIVYGAMIETATKKTKKAAREYLRAQLKKTHITGLTGIIKTVNKDGSGVIEQFTTFSGDSTFRLSDVPFRSQRFYSLKKGVNIYG